MSSILQLIKEEIQEFVNELESPLDPNNIYSNIPQGYDANILYENPEEKYYLATDKSGRGRQKPVKLTKTQIEKTWDLNEVSWFNVSLGEFLEESYIGDVWETRTERLECIQIY